MRNFVFSTFVLWAAMFAGQSQADERLFLQFGDLNMDEQNTLNLKDEIRYQYPDLNIENYQLKAINVVAKTYDGRGSAYLQIGSATTYAKRFGGSPDLFYSRDENTFDRVDFYSPTNQPVDGSWLLRLNGNFIIRRMMAVVESNHVPPQPECRYYLNWPHYYWGTRNIYSTIEGAVWNQNQGEGARCGNGSMTSCVSSDGYLYWRGRYLGDGRDRYEICRRPAH
jgi:hypothetical protein